MENKLIVFDLDGTLLTSDKKVTEGNKKAVWKCREKRLFR